jgi:hypothetical protein
MNNFTEIQYDLSNGNTALDIGIGILNYEKMACQVVVSAYGSGTTDITIQESNNGLDWNNIVDNSGSALTIAITSSGSYMLKTSIFYGRFIRAEISSKTTGILNVITYFKDKNT